MTFTYEAYRNLLASLREHGYAVADYKSWKARPRCVILRHDIDFDPEAAWKLARVEQEEGVHSTYFVLVSGDFYNPFSWRNREILRAIQACGHAIGLHFDETVYPETGSPEGLKRRILEEARLLSDAAGETVEAVSMHRPSRAVLEADLELPGLVNSYGRVFFKEFKYLSDSRHCWREPAEEIIASECFERLQILTHAFWYHGEEISLRDAVAGFVRGGNRFRYETMESNITDLQAIMKEEDLDS